MNDVIVSWIRTAVPAAVALALIWVADKLGLEIDENTAAAVTGLVVLAVLSVYYLVVRKLEARWPKLGVLLGVPKQPVYPPVLPPADRPAPTPGQL